MGWMIGVPLLYNKNKGIVKHEPRKHNKQQHTATNMRGRRPISGGVAPLSPRAGEATKSSHRRSPTSVCRLRARLSSARQLQLLCAGAEMAPIINERGGRHIDIDGRRLLFKHNNQIKVGFNVGRGFGEDARPGRNVWGGRLPFVWGGSLKTKK